MRLRPALPRSQTLAALALACACSAEAAPATIAQGDAPVAAEALPGRRAAGTGLARRPDERRPDKGTVVELFGTPVRLSGEYEAAHDTRWNLDFDTQRKRDRSEFEHELKLEASFSPRQDVTVFLKVKGDSQVETWRETGEKESSGTIERDQMWVFFAGLGGSPVDLQVGRIALLESRSWWWDRDLDAARIFIGDSRWLVETGVARELAPVSLDERRINPDLQDVMRWFGRAAWAWRAEQSVEGYWLLARDRSGRRAPGRQLHDTREDPIDGDLNWFGLRASGEQVTADGHRVGYWLDAARLTGREWRTVYGTVDDKRLVVIANRRQNVDAAAWDLGLRWSLPGKARPTAWIGWANGTGDGNAGDGTDHTFRQTGLHENKGRFGGVKRFHYYGELFRPNLSNLAIASLGVSRRFLDNSSVDLVLHDYRQRHASTALATTRITADPNGTDRDLGRELDLFFAFRESKRLEFTTSLAAFRAGPAFGANEGDTAYYLELGMTWNF